MELVFDESDIVRRRERVESLLDSDVSVILVGSGKPIAKPGGLDQTYKFIPHPDYYWLSGNRRWGGVVAYDRNDGWIDFVRPVTAVERLWEGDIESPRGVDVAELEAWLKQRIGQPIAMLGAPVEGVVADTELTTAVQVRFDEARRVKDAAELQLLKRAIRATAAGFARARQIIRPGISERAVQIEMEGEFFRHGADDVGYETIVAAGVHAAVLHSLPSTRELMAGEVMLIDAGGAIAGYTADVTRTYASSGRFTPEQQAIYDIVLAAEWAAIEKCRPGVEWHDVHGTAAAAIASGLKDLGLLRIGVDEALESGAIALFFPHGVGHMVGLGVRDVGGRAPGREEGRMCCGARVRVDLPLASGFVMTVEPGVYFVPAILDDVERREKFREAINWDGLARWRGVGGVRIEDNIHVTSGGAEVLTAEIGK